MMERRDFVTTIGLGFAGLSVNGSRTKLVAAVGPPVSTDDPVRFAAFIEEFVAAGRQQTPSDLSVDSFARDLSTTRAALAKLRAIDAAKLDVDDGIDWKFAQSILVGRELQQVKIQSWKRDPRMYMPFRSIPIVIGRPGGPAQKSDEVPRLVSAVPTQLQRARANLAVCVPRFQELGVFMAEGARNIVAKDVPRFAESSQKRTLLLKTAGAAGRAFDDYITFLKTDLARRPVGEWAIGRTTYDEMVHGQYLLTQYNSDTLYKYGWDQFNQTVQKLEEVARTIDSQKTWRQLADKIKQDHPDPMTMIEAHQQWVDKARAHIVGKNLVPIPWKERAIVVPRLEYLRKTSYYGDTAVGRSLGKPYRDCRRAHSERGGAPWPDRASTPPELRERAVRMVGRVKDVRGAIR